MVLLLLRRARAAAVLAMPDAGPTLRLARRAGGPRPKGRPGRKCARARGGRRGRGTGPAGSGGAPSSSAAHTRGHQRKRRPLTARPSFKSGTDDSSKRDCHRRRRRLPSRGSGELTPPGRRRRPTRTTRPAAGPSLAPGRPHPAFTRRSSSVGPGLLRPWRMVRRVRPAR